MNAKTITAETPEALRAALEASAAEGFAPTLAIVFAPTAFETVPLAEMLDSYGIAIFGAHTPDKFTDQGMAVDEVTLLLTDLDPACFRIVVKSIPMGDYRAGYEATRDIAAMGKAWFDQPAFLVCVSQMEVPGEAVIEGFLSVAGEEAPVIGGYSGGKPYWADHVVFTNKAQHQHGIICLVLDQDRVALQGLAVSGWKPAGTPKTVTRSEGNWIYTIDHEPAFDVLVRFTGAAVNRDDSDDLLQQIGNSHPLQVIRSEGSAVMNPPLMYNKETGAVLCGGHIPEGARIRFSLPPDFDIVETVVDSARALKEEGFPEADAVLVFSCIGRQNTLGPLIDEEVNGLNAVWNAPMSGYFSLGEFGPTEGGRATYQGTTCSWVALKEKPITP